MAKIVVELTLKQHETLLRIVRKDMDRLESALDRTVGERHQELLGLEYADVCSVYDALS